MGNTTKQKKMITEKKILLIATLSIVLAVTIIISTWITVGNLIGHVKDMEIAPKLKTLKRVDITYDFTVTQGFARPGIEKVEINGTIWNKGEKTARNIAITALFIDEPQKKIVEKPIETKKDLNPEGHVKISANYFREKTTPKTSVKTKIRVEWLENGERKARILPSAGQALSKPVVFNEKIGRYHDRFKLELFPNRKGDYEVIFLFKEDGETLKCGDEKFYNVDEKNPITFIFPVKERSMVEYHIEIFGLDGMLLDEMDASTKVVQGL